MNPFGSILAFAAGLLVLWLICKLLAFPLKVLWKLVVNALLGAVILFLFNFVGGFFFPFHPDQCAQCADYRCTGRPRRYSPSGAAVDSVTGR